MNNIRNNSKRDGIDNEIFLEDEEEAEGEGGGEKEVNTQTTGEAKDESQKNANE